MLCARGGRRDVTECSVTHATRGEKPGCSNEPLAEEERKLSCDREHPRRELASLPRDPEDQPSSASDSCINTTVEQNTGTRQPSRTHLFLAVSLLTILDTIPHTSA
ncbi:hypothetical protein DPEC_G00286290 [Dallia pectoralis]|uniref:Uncharacterized protein n=1 Tax=Dallia pectoralis TaxID=75939 RepID=A0ACC2FKB1_DALPE|nr:hypothetical protein DPEC_G00286290 [Dallia pectoralis]